ncbi:putative acetyl-coenzyme A acyltransferase 2 [Mrakia frigida]|uniref:thiolase family protein n=1 Tax=Mrakia frigida TaxID=29902 RepID=UPI003FCBF0E8
MSALPQSFIVAAKRTPFGSFGGSLKDIKSSHLGGIAGMAALAELPEEMRTRVDEVIFGGVVQSDNSTPYLARHVGHLSGLPVTTPALTLNRLCGSGFQAIINASQAIRLSEGNLYLTGGTENMSMAPFTLHGTRWGVKYGVGSELKDSLSESLIDQNPTREVTPMGFTAENLAAKYGITREDCDRYALLSQVRHAAALNLPHTLAHLTSVPTPTRKDAKLHLLADEHPRIGTTMESLARLPPAFKKGGVVTAGNSSGIADGAAANVVASEAMVKEFGLKPLARVVSWGVTACAPELMGIGPVEAIKLALKRANLTIADMDIIDVNEAFASQFLAVQKELDLPIERTNLFGGAIAVGHPLGASGARIVGSLSHALQDRKERYALGAACIGGGQGIAVILERV